MRKDTINGQLSLWDIMTTEVQQADVTVNGALNVHTKGKIKPFEVTLTTSDLTLIVAMVEDYIRGLDEIKADDYQWQVYYRKKFADISRRIQDQIDYDYEKALKKCLEKLESNSDVGEEALSLMIKNAKKKAAEQQTKQEETKSIEK